MGWGTVGAPAFSGSWRRSGERGINVDSVGEYGLTPSARTVARVHPGVSRWRCRRCEGDKPEDQAVWQHVSSADAGLTELPTE